MFGRLHATDAANVLQEVASTVAAVEAELCSSKHIISTVTAKKRAPAKPRKIKADKPADTPEVAERKRKRNLADADRKMKGKAAAQLPTDFVTADLSTFKNVQSSATNARVSDSESEQQERVVKKSKRGKQLVLDSVSDSELEMQKQVVERSVMGGKGVRQAPPILTRPVVDSPESESSSSGEDP